MAKMLLPVSLIVALLAGCPGGISQTAVPAVPASGASSGAAASATHGAATAGPPRAVTSVEGISEYRLDNGLRVLLFPDNSQGKVTVNMTYFVGSRHEGYGEAGMAHLLEHMVFKGTPRHPDIWKALEDHGARFNGTTWTDRTNYYETLPASPANLDFALDLEADRMINSAIAAEDLEKEFSVVRNEFEQGESQPTSVLLERMHSAAFLWHNYGKSTIGNRSDIERVPVDSLRGFYKRYYQPDNAMLVVAGRFDADRALAKINELFGIIPQPSRKLSDTYTVEPVQDGEREVVLRRVGDVGAVGAVYHGVSGAHDDYVAIEAIMHVLTNEPSGRLYQNVVVPGLVSTVSGFSFAWRDPGTASLLLEVQKGQSIEKVRDKMLAVVEGLRDISQAEVNRFRNLELKNVELTMTNSQRVGIELSEWAAMGDWRLFFVHRDRLERLTLAQVQAAAVKYFVRSNRTVGLFIPTQKPVRAPHSELPRIAEMTDGYRGRKALEEGEAFDASIENIEKRTVRGELRNGLKLALLAKKTRGGSVTVTFTVRFGDEAGLRGKTVAAELIPEMLMRGTKKHSFQELKDEFDRLKAQVSFGNGSLSGNGVGAATVSIKTVSDKLPEVLALVAEVFREPAFPAAQFEILRKERLTTLEEQLQDPMTQGFVAMFRALAPWPASDVRYRPTTAEKIALIKKVKLATLKALHQRYWGAKNATVAVVGDFHPEQVRAEMLRYFGDWTSRKPFKRIAVPFKESLIVDQTIKTPDKKMAVVAAGHSLELRDDDPDYAALEFAGYVLAGGGSSRLMQRLRQKEGLSYGAFGGVIASSLDRNGFVFTMAICAPQNASKAMAIMLDELEKLGRAGIGESEIAASKKAYLETFKTNLANDRYLVGTLENTLYLGRTLAFQGALNEEIAKLTPAQVNAAIKKHISMAKLAKVTVGDL